eukprot:365219-Chlamydomonas_euryale.AAC.14
MPVMTVASNGGGSSSRWKHGLVTMTVPRTCAIRTFPVHQLGPCDLPGTRHEPRAETAGFFGMAAPPRAGGHGSK